MKGKITDLIIYKFTTIRGNARIAKQQQIIINDTFNKKSPNSLTCPLSRICQNKSVEGQNFTQDNKNSLSQIICKKHEVEKLIRN